MKSEEDTGSNIGAGGGGVVDMATGAMITVTWWQPVGRWGGL